MRGIIFISSCNEDNSLIKVLFYSDCWGAALLYLYYPLVFLIEIRSKY